MKFSEDRKRAIQHYILEKIAEGDSSVSKTVAEVFQINQTTVHSYINELLEQEVIRKERRGQYELVQKTYHYELCRGNGDLDDDTFAYLHCVQPLLAGTRKNVQMIWNYCVSEMFNNVIDHSGAEKVEIIISQDVMKTVVSISDDGVGIFEKIRAYFQLPNLEEAICELFKGKLTTDSQRHSGEGIFFSSKLMDDFYIFSDGKVFTNNKYGHSEITEEYSEHKKENTVAANLPNNNQTKETAVKKSLSNNSQTKETAVKKSLSNNGQTKETAVKKSLSNNSQEKGTTVVMALSNNSHKTAKEIFDQFADEDGSFFRTSIPMKNIFDVPPVSRSQAKRICYRLEKFGEVVIDFDEIEWIGQGFAHQLFVVFANANPEIKIIPIHMNEDVEKMVYHVMHS